MPAALGRFNPAAQKSQPQTGIKLSMEEEALLTIRFRFRDNRLCQGGFIRPEGKRQRRTHLAQAPVLACNHKLACIGIARGQLIVEEPQNGLVMVWDIRSQYVNQCSHARLRQSKNTPQQAAK